MKLHHKRTGIRFLTLLLALSLILGCGTAGIAFGATADPEDVSTNSSSITVGSSLFTSSQYVSISADEENGVAVRLNEQISDNEYASTTYTNELFMNQFFVKFSINDDIASNMELIFHYDYVQDESNWNYTPEEYRKTLTLRNEDGKISASWEGGSAVTTDLDFVGSDLTVAVKDGKILLNDQEIGSTADMFPEKRATLEFRLSDLGDRTIETDEDEQKATFFLKEMGYTSETKINGENDVVTQSFIGDDGKVADTSRPVPRIDVETLPTYVAEGETENQTYTHDGAEHDLYYAPNRGKVTVPISSSTCMDIVKSSITVKMKVVNADTVEGLFAEDVESLPSNLITGNSFIPQAPIYYAVNEITVSDGKNTVTLTEGDTVDGVTLPLVYRSFWDKEDPVLQNYGSDFINGLNLSTLNGGSDMPLQLPYPKMGTSLSESGVQLVEPIGTADGVKYFANNPKSLNYKLSYKTESSSTWSSNDGLTYTATSEGWVSFHVQVLDTRFYGCSESVNDANLKEDVFRLVFADVNPLKLTISGFSDEKYLNQSVSLPSATVKDPMGSTSSTIEVFFTHKKVGDEYVEFFNSEWKYKTNAEGEFILEDGKKVLDLDSDGFRQPAVYTEEDEAENAAHPAGQIIYIDNDGNRLDYTQVDGEWVCEGKVYERVSTSTSFTPKYLGKYKAVYSAKDSAGNVAEDVTRDFEVVKPTQSAGASTVTSGGLHLNTMSIVFLSIAGACAVAIVVLLFIKPKEKTDENAK